MSTSRHDHLDETLVEMTYRWPDIEELLVELTGSSDDYGEERAGLPTRRAIDHAFRVEAVFEQIDVGNERAPIYVLFFDVEDADARSAATLVREERTYLDIQISRLAPVWYSNQTHKIRVTSIGAPGEGLLCARKDKRPSNRHIDVSEVPTERPTSNVPLTELDGYWLTPIEVPFYEALRETGLVFSVQPWIQGVDSRFRLDFLIFYGGGMVAVELDGHESHRTKEQRQRDAARDRWFAARRVRTHRWTGSEVHANPQECVRQLLEILRGSQARA